MAGSSWSCTQIRKGTANDVAWMVGFDRENAIAAHWSQKQYRDLFTSSEGGPTRLVLVAENPGNDPSQLTPLGFLVAHHVAPEWELENIIVSRSARRMGVGTQLLQSLLHAARETHSGSVFLEVRESNEAARTLYGKLGFGETGRRKSYYANPLEDAILYSFTVS